jgi:hypothetical protein
MIDVKTITVGPEILAKIPQLSEPGVRRRLAMNIMEGARNKLINLANQNLRSTRIDYIDGIQQLEMDGDWVVLTLTGVLPNMVENGWEARFLHDTLLADGTNYKVNADGDRYRSIPFRRKTEGGKGKAFPVTSANPALTSKELGKKLHGQAQKLITREEREQGQKGRVSLGKKTGAKKLKPSHHSDPYAGLVVQKQAISGGKTQRTYKVFRTISEAVPGAWYHPGIEAKEFFLEIDKYVDKIAPTLFESFAKELL